ncbi:hypothetical protein SLEP1_g36135 [Rubroshorea leprosula]|uniref:Uncharacterized protein n=1 Tax=Rubroshorea leprosula TaxID=152421 RepID=A0AAV5KR65_9ROSI|nr:hypothetical protein SLEP1_g36135 [Rubroshorea leprosula]
MDKMWGPVREVSTLWERQMDGWDGKKRGGRIWSWRGHVGLRENWIPSAIGIGFVLDKV